MPRRVSAWRGVVAAVVALLVVLLGPGVSETVNRQVAPAGAERALSMNLEQLPSHHGSPMGPVARLHSGSAQAASAVDAPTAPDQPVAGKGGQGDPPPAPAGLWAVGPDALTLPRLAAGGARARPAADPVPSRSGDTQQDRAPPASASA